MVNYNYEILVHLLDAPCEIDYFTFKCENVMFTPLEKGAFNFPNNFMCVGFNVGVSESVIELFDITRMAEVSITTIPKNGVPFLFTSDGCNMWVRVEHNGGFWDDIIISPRPKKD